MNSYVPRTVNGVGGDSPRPGSPKPLSAYQDRKCYVLLGAPGAGKTREFKEACERESESVFVSARDFLTLPGKRWMEKTIFIDALDEMRGQSGSDPRRPLDRICEKLDELGVPRFRLSCRDFDWLGASDTTALNMLLAGNDETCVLRLNPLNREDIERLAKGLHQSGLLNEAQGHGLLGLLEIPLILNLFVNARKHGKWPESISEAFLWGCQQLAREQNKEYRVQGDFCSTEEILAEAGLLSAIILLSGLEGIEIQGSSVEDDIVSLSELSEVQLPLARRALASRLFEVKAQVARPMHRQVAEFLAAKYLAARIDEGLSPNRLLALFTERGERIAAPLRGLAAWLSVHSRRLREPLMRLDPIGTVSFGDIGGFSRTEKQKLLACLEEVSAKNPWTLPVAAQNARWGALVTPEMAEDVKTCLLEAPSKASRKWLSYALLDALSYVQSLPSESAVQFRDVLDRLVDEGHVNGFSWLVERLLTELYPNHLSASDLPKYARFYQADRILSYFWGVCVVDRTEPMDIPVLLDGLCALAGPDADEGTRGLPGNDQFSSLFAQLLAKLLNSEASVRKDRLYFWLATATENDGPNDDLRRALVSWLEKHPHDYEEINQKIMAESTDPEWDRYRMLGGYRPRGPKHSEVRDQLRQREGQRELSGIDFRENRDQSLQNAVARGDGRLLTSLGGDEALARTATYAVRQTPRRADLPSAQRVIDSAGTDQRFRITDAYLLGLSLIVKKGNDLPTWFDDGEMRRALAFRLCALSTASEDEPPFWYAHLLRERPKLVADVFSKVAMRTFRSEDVDFPRLYDLSKDDHESVARLVLMPLLDKFPTRGVRQEKLYVLLNLLQVAFRLESKAVLLKLAERKLACKSLAKNQRVYWTCFGLVLDGSAYVERLRQQFQGRGGQRLLPHLVEFLYRFKTNRSRRLPDFTEIDAIKALVQILGPGFNPNWFRDETSWPRHETYGPIIVNSLINALAQNPSVKARAILAELAEAPDLHHLRERFLLECENHRHHFPQVGFEHVRPEALCLALQR